MDNVVPSYQEKALEYSAFALKLIAEEGDKFQKIVDKYSYHPVLKEKFQELFPDSEMKT